MRLRSIVSAVALLACIYASGAAIDDAKRLYREGAYTEALEKLRAIVKRSPRDGTANYYLGATLMALGEEEDAIAPLKVAEGRGVADASRLLAIDAIDKYRTDDASEHLEAWEKTLKKGKKNVTLPDELNELSSKVVQLRNMLERVEKIEIVDTLSVDSATFFNYYRISESAGKILPAEVVRRLGAGNITDELSTAYLPQNRSELIWSAADTSGVFKLYGADILDDGTIDHTRTLGEDLGEGGDAMFPFLMPDGMTLYFANNGENSLGGFDIFMTRRTEDGDYFQPQNVGMPYNSPDNDYLLAIDEASGLGWWATDRNHNPGKVTIYIFKPSAMRVNADPDDEALQSLAKLDNIEITRTPGTDYKGFLESHLPEVSDDDSRSGMDARTFAIDMGNGKVYTTLSDFKESQARSTMLEVLGVESEIRRLNQSLEELRNQYRSGDNSVRGKILSSEAEAERLRARALSLRNKAVRLENK